MRLTPEQKREDDIRRAISRINTDIHRLWKRGDRESKRLVRDGLYEQEQALRDSLWRRCEAMLEEATTLRRQLPPFVIYRDGFHEMVPVTPELIAQAEQMDREARR